LFTLSFSLAARRHYQERKALLRSLFTTTQSAAKVPGVPWKDGSNCSICKAAFGLLLRKHHCRNCGDVVCGKPFCSGYQLIVDGAVGKVSDDVISWLELAHLQVALSNFVLALLLPKRHACSVLKTERPAGAP
jgi:hypothetical protein